MEATSARDAIRACALRLFAERGIRTTTVRDIAACAGVSPALVLHHFGSKAGLREAVDAEVGTIFDGLAEGDLEGLTVVTDGGPAAAPTFAEMLLSSLPPGSPVPAYLRRLLLEGDPAGHRLFHAWFQASRRLVDTLTAMGAMRTPRDPDARAAFLLVNDLAMILLRDHVADAIGTDPLTPAGTERWAADAIEAYTYGTFRKADA